MLEAARRLFKLQKGEGPKVLQFCLLSALLQAGLAIGVSAADALFLTRVGADRLPVIFLLTPLVMLVYIPAYAYLVSRWGIDRVLDLTLGALVVGGVCLSVILAKPQTVLFYAAKLYAGLWYIALYTLFWNFTDSFYDIQDAKRLFPIFSGGASTGAMLGGGLVGIASRHMPVQRLFLAWAVLALVTLPLAMSLRRRWKRIETEEQEEQRSFVQEIRETRRFMRGSPYVRIFAAVLFTVLGLTAAVEFQYSALFAHGRSEAQLAALLGTLFAAVNAFNLLLNFLLFNRMVLRWGVGNVILVTPLVYLAAFLLLLFHGGFSAGLFGFFAYQGILASIDWNNINFLFNAVPASARRQVRTVMEGLWEPVATAAAGGFLLLFGTSQGYSLITHRATKEGVAFLAPDGISALGLGGAVLYLVLAAFLRASYVKSMVANMKREWLDFSRAEAAVLSDLDPGEVRALADCATGDPKNARAALRILWLNDRKQALDRLLAYLTLADEAEREAAAPLLAMMLEEEEHESLRAVLEWLDAHRSAVGPALLQVLAHHGLMPPQEAAQQRQSADPEERAAAVIASWNAWNLADRLEAVEAVHTLLGGEREERVAAVRALGWAKDERGAHTAAALLQDPDREVRREALAAVHRLATPDSSRLIAALLQAVAAGDPEERLLGMEALREIADPGSIRPLLALSDRFAPAERRQAEAMLCGIGLRSVPAAVAVLRDARASYPARSIAARALARIAFPQLEALSSVLIHTELQRAYQCLHFHRVLEGARFPLAGHFATKEPERWPTEPEQCGQVVLSRYYRGQPGVIVDFVLEVLTLGGRLPHFERISAALRFGSRKERGDALETIEQAVSRDIFRVLLPLVDGRSIEEQLRFFHSRFRPDPITPGEIVRAALESSSAVESAAAAQALWEGSDPDAVSLLRARLRKTHQDFGFWILDFGLPTVRDTILSLLTEGKAVAHKSGTMFDGTVLPKIQNPKSKIQNPVERLAVLARSSFFEFCSMAELEAIAGAACWVRLDPGEWLFRAGELADTCFVIAEGTAVLETETGQERQRMGAVLGEEALFGETIRRRAARSEGVVGLRIAASAITEAVRTYPRLGIGLLAEKMKVHSVA